MPYAGSHYQFAEENCCVDGFLNVLFFSNLSKLDLARYISGGIYPGKPEDPRIKHYCVRELNIETEPPMPVMVDGSVIGEGKAHISLKRKALQIYSGR
jgi:diacylglycerol kinase family enzyme